MAFRNREKRFTTSFCYICIPTDFVTSFHLRNYTDLISVPDLSPSKASGIRFFLAVVLSLGLTPQ